MSNPPHAACALSLIGALFLQLIALPDAIASTRPLFLPLVVVYWALADPRVPALSGAFVLGLTQDVMLSSVMGQHASGLVLLVYLVARLRGVFILFPLWQASIALAPGWLAYCLLMSWIDRWTGHHADDWSRWLPALTTTVLWPLAYAALDRACHRKETE